MRYEAIVIGVGAMGAAALLQLSSRSRRVLGIERFSVPNGRGSSTGDTRLVRMAYAEHADYVPLVTRAWRQWQTLQKQHGEPLLYPTGLVYIGPQGGELVDSTRYSAELHDLPMVELSSDGLRARWPQFALLPGYLAVEEPQAGFVMCERAVAALAAHATECGAELLTGTRVHGWQAENGGVSVTTSRGTFRADRLVITVGSWSAELLQLPALSLQVTRQSLFWVQPSRPAEYALGRFPCWAIERADAPGLLYGFPDGVPGALRGGAKVAYHQPGPPCVADDPKQPPPAAAFARIGEAIAPFLPGLEGAVVDSASCMYTMSDDGHFIVDRHPACDAVVFAAGFSGHGFKFAPVIGELLADYALEGGTGLPAGFLRMSGRDLTRGSGLPSP